MGESLESSSLLLVEQRWQRMHAASVPSGPSASTTRLAITGSPNSPPATYKQWDYGHLWTWIHKRGHIPRHLWSSVYRNSVLDWCTGHFRSSSITNPTRHKHHTWPAMSFDSKEAETWNALQVWKNVKTKYWTYWTVASWRLPVHQSSANFFRKFTRWAEKVSCTISSWHRGSRTCRGANLPSRSKVQSQKCIKRIVHCHWVCWEFLLSKLRLHFPSSILKCQRSQG